MKHLKRFEALSPYFSLSQYGITPEEFREIRKEVDKENKERQERLRMFSEITDRIRHDKLSQKDINMLFVKSKELRDDNYHNFLRKMPPPTRKRIKDATTKEAIEKYLNLNV